MIAETDRMLNAAQELATSGLYVFPAEPGGKRPLIRNWPMMATVDQGQIRAWWARWPDANIAVICGKKSGIFVIDIDGEKGKESLKLLESEYEQLPSTRESRTGSGGRHLFFKYPNDREVRNKQSFMPGIDVRGEGGYVIVPPSILKPGQFYSWEN